MNNSIPAQPSNLHDRNGPQEPAVTARLGKGDVKPDIKREGVSMRGTRPPPLGPDSNGPLPQLDNHRTEEKQVWDVIPAGAAARAQHWAATGHLAPRGQGIVDGRVHHIQDGQGQGAPFPEGLEPFTGQMLVLRQQQVAPLADKPGGGRVPRGAQVFVELFDGNLVRRGA
jgi:hypothetical protein